MRTLKGKAIFIPRYRKLSYSMLTQCLTPKISVLLGICNRSLEQLGASQYGVSHDGEVVQLLRDLSRRPSPTSRTLQRLGRAIGLREPVHTAYEQTSRDKSVDSILAASKTSGLPPIGVLPSQRLKKSAMRNRWLCPSEFATSTTNAYEKGGTQHSVDYHPKF